MAIKAKLGGRPRIVNLLCNWLHQAFFYLDRTEKIARFIFEVFLLWIVGYLIQFLTSFPFLSFWNLIFSFVFVHTFNWIFNGNWWACMLFAFPKMKNPGEVATCCYLNEMSERIRRDSSVSGVLIFGSIARSRWHERSDIDLRILRKPGFKNAVCALLVQFRERVFALFSKQPLDMYLADDIHFLKKMRLDENPVILLMKDSSVESIYPHAKEIFLKKCNAMSENSREIF